MSKSTSESGDAINIANFKKLIDTCTSFGADYDPSNDDLTLPNMTTRWKNDDGKEKGYISLVQGTRTPVNDRKDLFTPLDPLVTRSMGELDSTKASPHMKDLARTIADDIRGMNVKSQKKESPDAATELDTVSQSHQSFVSKTKNFYSFIELLITIPEYKPKKADLTTASLMDYYTQLDDANNGIASALMGAKNAGIELNELLYAPETGMVDVALMCKNYVKGLYGASDPRFKMVNGIKFKNLNKNK
jgi:hypothetical protein